MNVILNGHASRVGLAMADRRFIDGRDTRRS